MFIKHLVQCSLHILGAQSALVVIVIIFIFLKKSAVFKMHFQKGDVPREAQ